MNNTYINAHIPDYIDPSHLNRDKYILARFVTFKDKLKSPSAATVHFLSRHTAHGSSNEGKESPVHPHSLHRTKK